MLNFVRNFMNTVQRLKGDRKGVSALEYGILAGVVGAGLALAVPAYIQGVTTLFTNVGNAAAAVVVGNF